MKSFRLRGIKGFLDTGDLDLRPLTVLIGQNSSGKSAIVRFPLVLRQTFLDDSVAPLLFYGKSIDYGHYESVVFKHNRKRPIEFSFTVSAEKLAEFMRVRHLSEIPMKEWLYQDLQIKVKIQYRSDSIVVTDFSVCIPHLQRPILSMRENADHTYTMEFAVHTGDSGESWHSTTVDGDRVGFDKFLPDYRMFRVAYRDLRQLDFYYGLLSGLNGWLNAYANAIQYIGPIRRTPDRTYRYKENAVKYVGTDGEFAPVILGQDRRKGSYLIQDVSDWLRAFLGFELEVEDLRGEMFRIMIRDLTTKGRDNLIDVGYGLSQLMPIIVQTFYRGKGLTQATLFPESNDINIIEQPELHLHPSAQSSLADLFLAGMRGGKRFLIETHSEHMLLRLRRYIAEGLLDPDDVALYYTHKEPSEGSISVNRLEIDELGEIPNWPKGFFSEDFKEYQLLRKARRTKLPQGDNPLW